MKRSFPHLAVLLVAVLVLSAARADIVCGTWNLKWFPSGRAEHRGEPAAEAATVRAAAKTLAAGIDATNPSGQDGVILFLQELRDLDTCTNLVAVLGRTNLVVAAVSGFRERDRRMGWQQCGIVTSLPVIDASWSRWRRAHSVVPPRGYAYALLDGGTDGLVACFCVHLKSNYGATTPTEAHENALKRETCAEELATLAKKLKSPDGRKVKRIVVAGDFNTDSFADEFKGEATFATLEEAVFTSCFEGAKPEARNTHPGAGKFAGGTLDYVLYRGFKEQTALRIISGAPVSDHNAVFVRLR